MSQGVRAPGLSSSVCVAASIQIMKLRVSMREMCKDGLATYEMSLDL